LPFYTGAEKIAKHTRNISKMPKLSPFCVKLQVN